ncbi:POK9 protein, partial [Nothoprocta pentlandii]|nr:POK9 protein [Nothoprocta pentlandii]
TGSAGVDLGTAVETTLMDSQVQCIATNVKGPLGYGLSALLLGRSSMTQKGLFVLPGVIDADFTGTISIMVWMPSPPVHIPTGTQIGQLVPFKAAVPLAEDCVRGDGGFGSTGRADIDLAMDISKAKPMERVTLKEPGGNTCKINMLVDTGADITIVS